MKDNEIISLFEVRDEHAIEALSDKYHPYCYKIAWNLLTNKEDSEECLNDTWLRAWNAIPPARPQRLGPFLGTITRNLALNRIRQEQTQKRGSGVVQVAIEELGECIPAASDVYEAMEEKQLTQIINAFLAELPQEKRVAFVLRYYYGTSIQQIAKRLRCSESRVKSMLYRIRGRLKVHLEQEGIQL